MTVIAAFTTDWSQEPVVDEIQSQIQGKQVFVPGQKRLSHGGTFWYRGSMPLMEMSKHDDWDVFLSWTFRSRPDGLLEFMDVATGEYRVPDIAYTQRWMSEEAPEQYRRARAAGMKIICDLDDDFWSLGKTNIAYHTTDPSANKTFNRAHYWDSLKECDAITVSTEALRRRVEKLGVPTFILRNAIDIERWPQNDPGEDGMYGWIGGLQWRAHDLQILKVNGFPDFLESNNLPVYHGGDSQVPGVDKFYTPMGVDPTKVQCCAAPLCHIAAYPGLWAPINVSLIPLEQVPFNHAKCVDTDARVHTTRGTKSAGNLQISDTIWTSDGWSSVEAVEPQPRKFGKEIRTEYGRVLRVSDDHRLWVNDGWKTADLIDIGDRLTIVPGGESQVDEYMRVNWPGDSRVSRVDDRATAFLSAVNGPTVLINEAWALFLGLFVGDGSVGQGTQVIIHCDGQDVDVVDWVDQFFGSMGLKSFMRQGQTFTGIPVRKQYVGASSANLVRFLYGLGMVEWRGDNVGKNPQRRVLRVPPVIWSSPRSVQVAFLQGLFESDGTTDRGVVSFTTKDEQLAIDVQLLLASLGIESFKKEHWNKSKVDSDKRFQSFTVRLRRAGSNKFADLIGFLSHRKHNKLSDAIIKKPSNAFKQESWWDDVVSVQSVEIDTIDIQVTCGEFVVESIRVHNSWLKSLESCAAGVPYIVSAKFPEQERLIAEGTAGRQARNDKPSQWQDHFYDLLDPDVRREEGKINRAIAEQHDVRNRWTEWAEVYGQFT